MKIDAVFVDKNLPDWANGRVVNVEGRLIMMLRKHPVRQWPKWWNRFGKLIGWKWLEKRNKFMQRLDGKCK